MGAQVSSSRPQGEQESTSDERIFLITENGVNVRNPFFLTSRDKLDEYMVYFLELARRAETDWPELLGRDDVDPSVWQQKIVISFGENKYADDVGQAEVCVGALALMCMQRSTVRNKDHWWINPASFERNEALGVRPRHKKGAHELFALQFDHDGVTADAALRRGAANSGFLICRFSSASHGKSSEVITDYTEWASKQGKPRLPTNDSMAEFLNRECKHGPAYRDVAVDTSSGRQDEDGRWGHGVTFAPQDRIRTLVPFLRPIPRDLLVRLLRHKDGMRRLGESIEQDVFGLPGADPSGFRVTQPAYLPAAIEGRQQPEGFEHFGEVIGHHLYDAIPVAEALVAELEAQEALKAKPSGTTERRTCATVPAGLQSSLRGVRVASLLSEQHPELLRDESDAGQPGPWVDGDALYLAGCPFSDGHTVRRGEDDGAIYVFDPNGEFQFPVVRCWHQSCADRTTKEFVGAMIENGSLTADEVYRNANYRDIYEYRYGGPSTHDGHNVKAFLARYDKTFQIESLLTDKGLVGSKLKDGGVLTDHGQFARNPHQERGFAFGRDRLESLIMLLQEGKISIADLTDPRYGGGAFSAGRSACPRSLRVADRDGRGLDVEVFHAAVVSKPGLLDFAKLSELAGVQIADDVTPVQLAGFVESGKITVGHLGDCVTAHRAQDQSPYLEALRELSQRNVRDGMLQRDVDAALAEIAKKFGAKQKAIEADFGRVASGAGGAGAAIPGLLSAEDTALIQPFRDYCRDFAIINTGGKGVVLNLKEPDLSKAIMPPDAFEFLYRNDWFEVEKDGEETKTIFPAKVYLAKPPKDAQVYRGGLVFKPSGTVGPDQHNLYRGMQIEPDESGSYEMFKTLIREVWVQGDDAAYEWVMEWFMHIIAHPGEKIGTSLAIRGKYGDGKSIVTEKLMNSILGDMLLRVANQKLILGDFNEAIIGKLLIVLEEAAFAGDKAAFDRMKELITGPRVVINPKFKAPITVDNHARMLVTSNHPHFMHLKPGDRRYTVLESSSAWRGTDGADKFASMVDEWDNGGAARFVHDSLNRSFRRFDDRRQLIVNTNLRTAAGVRQIAHSRSPIEKCIASFLLRGDFVSPKDRFVILQVPDGDPSSKEPLWALDRPFCIPSQNLQDSVAIWVRELPQAPQHELTLHTIIATLEEFVGDTQAKRPKDRKEGERVQGPTVRELPSRRAAIMHARKQGMITEVEFLAALPDEEAEPRA